MVDGDEWWEGVREIRTSGTTGWWRYMYACVSVRRGVNICLYKYTNTSSLIIYQPPKIKSDKLLSVNSFKTMTIKVAWCTIAALRWNKLLLVFRIVYWDENNKSSPVNKKKKRWIKKNESQNKRRKKTVCQNHWHHVTKINFYSLLFIYLFIYLFIHLFILIYLSQHTWVSFFLCVGSLKDRQQEKFTENWK